MSDLPFALALSSNSGWSWTTLAKFADADGLWLFWQAWSAQAATADLVRARFVHTGRVVHHVRPFGGRAEFDAWTLSRRA